MAWTANPSSNAKFGSGTAVSAMSNAQLSQYLSDASLGAANLGGVVNGLLHRLADGRATDADYGDKEFIKAKLSLGQSI
jgi:hypothetical protein